MKLVYEHQTHSTQSENPINLIAVFRDEAVLLPHFIDYYKNMGVNQFFMIDNQSEDTGANYLKTRKDIDIKLFYTEESYNKAFLGNLWAKQCMDEYCANAYCLRVDIDELISFETPASETLNDLCKYMEANHMNVVPGILLDLYPKFLNDDYIAGQDFSDHSQYFDPLDSGYYRSRGILYGKSRWLEGGLRARTLNTYNIIHKFPFFKNSFHDSSLIPGAHFFYKNGKALMQHPEIILCDTPCILLHYKFIKPDFIGYLKKQIENNEHWNNAQEYRTYFKALKDQDSPSFFSPDISRQLKSKQDLKTFFNLLKVS